MSPLRKSMFILPNLFTLSSIFCGFYAIVMVSGVEVLASHMHQAAMLIAFALFFDVMDGRVARLTRTQSDFGVELDSLADIVSFGVAPALVAYKYGLHHLGSVGVFIAFAYAGCGAIRLARFNVLARRDTSVQSYFTGLPIPLAAGVLMSIILANRGAPLGAASASTWAVLMCIVAYLMVSNVRYRTFKKLGSKRWAAVLALFVLSSFALISRLFHPGVGLMAVLCAYGSLGLVEELVFFASRRRDDKDDEAEEEDPDEKLA